MFFKEKNCDNFVQKYEIMAQKLKLTAKTFQGLENILSEELKKIGATDIKILKRAVGYTGTLETVYRSNYELRTAVKILQEIKVFKATDAESLYNSAKRIPWEEYFTLQDTFAVNSVVFSDNFNHSGFPALKVKDAIADRFREKKGARPNVSPKDPDIRVEVHIAANRCTISIDTTGEPLFKRGYRAFTGLAPLSEILAAGMVLHTNLDEVSTFIDPMCGSSTILTEAAMIHLNIPPAINRVSFAFENSNNFDAKLWKDVKEKADSKIKTQSDIKFLGYDIDQEIVRTARMNIKNADLEDVITIEHADFFDISRPAETGMILTNPPYDLRLRSDNILEFYNEIGTKLKHDFNGWEAWILSGNMQAMKRVGLRPAKKLHLLNGQVPARFNKYELYMGSKKVKSEKTKDSAK